MSRAKHLVMMAAVGERVGAAQLTLALGCLTVFMANLDTTILNVALPTMGHDLGAATSGLQWTVNAYVLARAGSQAMMTPATLAMLAHAYPSGPARAQALRVWSASTGIAMGLDPVVGGCWSTRWAGDRCSW